MEELLKSWSDKELYKTSIRYSLAVKQYEAEEKDNHYYNMLQMIYLLQKEIDNRR